MNFQDVFKKSFLEGFTSMDISAGRVMAAFVVTCALALYIFIIYRVMTRKSFYSKSFNVALAALSVITAAIILAMQSNLVISLGMVGALSIIRFRTAIKDPMDLVFLFWSISVGIICGAGFTMIAVITSAMLTIVIVIFSMLPESRRTLILVINASSYKEETAIMQIVNENCQYARTRARNISKTNLNLAVEVRVQDQKGLIEELMKLESIVTASLVEQGGDAAV